jgi:hypothetical protein
MNDRHQVPLVLPRDDSLVLEQRSEVRAAGFEFGHAARVCETMPFVDESVGVCVARFLRLVRRTEVCPQPDVGAADRVPLLIEHANCELLQRGPFGPGVSRGFAGIAGRVTLRKEERRRFAAQRTSRNRANHGD